MTIESMLETLAAVCTKLESGAQVEPEHLEKILEFIRGFSDKCHHYKEEELLFPALEEAGVARYGGPIEVMLEEHDMGRDYVREFSDGVAQYKKGDKGAAGRIAKSARNYIGLLEEHIDKEENILYPMADGFIPPEKQQALLEGFEKIEREKIGQGKHEAFHKLLDNLRKIYL